jgi:hypothetical protein
VHVAQGVDGVWCCWARARQHVPHWCTSEGSSPLGFHKAIGTCKVFMPSAQHLLLLLGS